MNFDLISRIDPSNETSWKGKVFLTFDIDWAEDGVLLDTIELVENAALPATWFITHDTPLLERLAKNPLFELGIHPNFNDLLSSSSERGESAPSIVRNLMQLVPGATAVRSHSLVNSERLVDLFRDNSLTHIGNSFVPGQFVREIVPWPLWDGMVVVPHSWQDNVSMRLNKWVRSPVIGIECLNVLDFHPIHVFLNTETLDRYEMARPYFKRIDELEKIRSAAPGGTRSVLLRLLGL